MSGDGTGVVKKQTNETMLLLAEPGRWVVPGPSTWVGLKKCNRQKQHIPSITKLAFLLLHGVPFLFFLFPLLAEGGLLRSRMSGLGPWPGGCGPYYHANPDGGALSAQRPSI